LLYAAVRFTIYYFRFSKNAPGPADYAARAGVEQSIAFRKCLFGEPDLTDFGLVFGITAESYVPS